jgi:hypothetical protein
MVYRTRCLGVAPNCTVGFFWWWMSPIARRPQKRCLPNGSAPSHSHLAPGPTAPPATTTPRALSFLPPTPEVYARSWQRRVRSRTSLPEKQLPSNYDYNVNYNAVPGHAMIVESCYVYTGLKRGCERCCVAVVQHNARDFFTW